MQMAAASLVMLMHQRAQIAGQPRLDGATCSSLRLDVGADLV